jgi:hypothetical protein
MTSALFSVFGVSDPVLLPHMAGLFAEDGLVPAQFHAERFGDEMHVEVQFAEIEASRADHFAEQLRRLPIVSAVHLRLASAVLEDVA